MYSYPHTIDNGGGERLTFIRRTYDAAGNERLEAENQVQPGTGPPMHIHYKQTESLTVTQGRMGVQIQGQEPQFYGEGETATFDAGVPHKFWNAGTELLICTGWVQPIHNVEYFLTEMYKTIRENGGKRPGMFEGAWLSRRYRSEFGMMEVPAFVQNVIFPVVIFFGRLAGKHRKYRDAPEPV